jgi:cytochrome c553
MKSHVLVVVAAFLAVPAKAGDQLPQWAYPVNPPGTQAAPDDGVLRRLPGTEVAFTLTQIRDLFTAPDWRPGDHPRMPEIVAHGRKPDVFACGYCHLPNGQGRPENSSLAGLPAAYIVQQVLDFKHGVRKSSEPASLPVNLMIAVAKGVSEQEAKIAAEYFAALKPRPWIRVIEADLVPKTRVGGWMLVAVPEGGNEAIGQRIIEMPEDLERTELRDPGSGFVAYVPTGSVQRGAVLVAGGDGKVTQCAVCHGAQLRGMGPVPALAGRSPSYLFRQLYDLKRGIRNGPWAELMKPVVAALDEEDMLAIAAYAASIKP